MKKRTTLFILTLGVFSIINTEMGIIGILPLISSHFDVGITEAGLLISLFALAVAVAGPTMPLIFSGVNRKKAMLVVLGMFLICNLISAFASNFLIALIARVLPAFFHPIYCSLAFTVAASSVSKEEAPKAVSKVLMGVSAGMVLGVPIVSFIASATSLTIAMLSFAVVNSIAFIATILYIPSMPVKERLTYGEQLSVLRHPITWFSIIAVVLLNGAIFGVYSFLAEYLNTVTKFSENTISILLLVYGLANIIGNMIGGRGLSKSPIKFVVSFPFILGIVYFALLFMGEFTIPMFFIIFIWGVLAGAGANINQYWITSVALDAPEFANGLFLAATNLGTTIGTTVCGLFISGMGTKYIVLGGILCLILGMFSILLRVRIFHSSRA